MKNGQFILWVILTLGILLTSCEGNTDREWIVENSSSTAIEVRATLVFDSSTTTDNIDAGNNKTIAITNQLGGNSNPESPNDVLTSMLIINENGDTLKKDYSLSENWETSIEQTKKVPSNYQHEYILVVTNEDF